jgi:hypothetical protein
MLALLEERGELDNTIVVVTSDNGMPFPRMKAQEYELSNHMPLAIRWKNGIRAPGRTVDDYVSFVDPRADVPGAGGTPVGVVRHGSVVRPRPGRCLPVGSRRPRRDHVLIGKERHDVGRPNDPGLSRPRDPEGRHALPPQFRAVALARGQSGDRLSRMRRRPRENRGAAASPAGWRPSGPWELCFGKRGVEELYDVLSDPDCLRNLERRFHAAGA